MLNCMLHLPPGYDLENPLPLPTILWAYPRAYTLGRMAGQVSITASVLHLCGSFPAVSRPAGICRAGSGGDADCGGFEMANDTFTEQIVANAEAAIDAVVKMRVCDQQRVGVGGTVTGRLWP